MEKIQRLFLKIKGKKYELVSRNDESSNNLYINSPCNTKDTINESGNYVAPVSGWYKVTCIQGGSGIYLHYTTVVMALWIVSGGYTNTKYIRLTKGQVVPVTVGNGGNCYKGTEPDSSLYGGHSSFGDLVTSRDGFGYPTQVQFISEGTNPSVHLSSSLIGAGGCLSRHAYVDDDTLHNSYNDGIGYGMPGGGYISTDSTKSNIIDIGLGNGAPGAVILEYNDASKDNIIIDLKEFSNLVERIEQLENSSGGNGIFLQYNTLDPESDEFNEKLDSLNGNGIIGVYDSGDGNFTEIEVPNTPTTPPNVTPGEQIHFKAATSEENINIFSLSPSFTPYQENFQVYINNELTEQNYESLSFNENDDIIIKLINPDSYYPQIRFNKAFSSTSLNCIKEIVEPFPPMYLSKDKPVTDFSYAFNDCNLLTTLPKDLFRYNPEVTNFSSCFGWCRLKSVPEGIFSYNTKVTEFSYCFRHTGITSLPEDLFKYNTNVTSFYNTFYACPSLTNYRLIIGSPNVTDCTAFVSYASNVGVVVVPAGSTTYTTFRKDAFGYTVETY